VSGLAIVVPGHSRRGRVSARALRLVRAAAALADERDADLVVVGTREVGVIQRVLGQSVSQEIARRIHRDVMIVHPAQGR
jgi:nucleotide-binding universal stress UspA family protein